MRSTQTSGGDTCQPHAARTAALTASSAAEAPLADGPKRPPVSSERRSGVMRGGIGSPPSSTEYPHGVGVASSMPPSFRYLDAAATETLQNEAG